MMGVCSQNFAIKIGEQFIVFREREEPILKPQTLSDFATRICSILTRLSRTYILPTHSLKHSIPRLPAGNGGLVDRTTEKLKWNRYIKQENECFVNKIKMRQPLGLNNSAQQKMDGARLMARF